MGESRLEKGLRAVAWAVLAATVVALLAVGLWVQVSAPAAPAVEVFHYEGAAAEAALPEEGRR